MPRSARSAPGDVVFRCLNRGNDRAEIFSKEGDYAAFEKVMAELLDLVPMRLLAYCLMPNHWHLLLWPREDVDPFDFAQGRPIRLRSGQAHSTSLRADPFDFAQGRRWADSCTG